MTSSSTAPSSMWRDLSWLVGLPFVAAIFLFWWWHPWGTSFHPPPNISVFAVAAGQWDWEYKADFCRGDAETISFAPDSSLMIIADEKPWTDSTGRVHGPSEYVLQEHTDNRIRGRIRGEQRLTADGHPVVWDLVLTSPNTFVWERTDLSPLNRTKVLRRCPPTSTLRPTGSGYVPRLGDRVETTTVITSRPISVPFKGHPVKR